MERSLTKRYLVTDSLNTKFPDWFRSAKRRWVVVQTCRFVDNNGVILQDISLHSDFIHSDNYLDSFVFFTNQLRPKYKKYEQLQQHNSFKVWFKDMTGVLVPTKTINDSITERTVEVLDGFHFILELLLIGEF